MAGDVVLVLFDDDEVVDDVIGVEYDGVNVTGGNSRNGP